MNVEMRKISDNSMDFLISETNPAFANMLRRTLVADIPKLAIEDVIVYDNTSALFDEIVAHKLGMLPIPTPPEEFVERARCECKGEGCSRCTVHYTLSKDGPCDVYSRDLVPDRTEFAVVDKNVPLLKLLPGQRLIIEAVATLGTAAKHAKWQATCGVGYKYYPVIKIDQKKCDSHGGCIKICPKGIFKIEKKNVVVDQTRIEECTLCMACKEYCATGTDAIEVKGDESRIIFHFETDGSMKAVDALRYAVKNLKARLKDFDSLIGE